jgi:hypothetical protein
MLLLLHPREGEAGTPPAHVCFTYEGDAPADNTYAPAATFTYSGDAPADFTYEGEC